MSVPESAVITRDEYLLLRAAIELVLSRNRAVQAWGANNMESTGLMLLDSAVTDLQTVRNTLRDLDTHFRVTE